MVGKYCKPKTDFRNQAKNKVKQITKQQRKELKKQGRKEGKEDFLRKSRVLQLCQSVCPGMSRYVQVCPGSQCHLKHEAAPPYSTQFYGL